MTWLGALVVLAQWVAGAVIWTAAATVVGLALGRVIALRDREPRP